MRAVPKKVSALDETASDGGFSVKLI